MTADLLSAGLSAGFLAAFLIGLSFGSGPCNLTCLPYMGPVLLGPAASQPFRALILPFMLGRLLGYMLLGTVAAWLGAEIEQALAHPALPLAVAALTAWLAFRLFMQAGRGGCSAAAAPARPDTVQNTAGAQIIATDAEAAPPARNALQLMLLGGSLAMNPCVPLLGLLAAAAQSGDPLMGAGLAMAFGLGAILIPVLLVRYGVALLGQELRRQLARWQTTLTRTGAGLLLLLAVNTGLQGVPGITS